MFVLYDSWKTPWIFYSDARFRIPCELWIFHGCCSREQTRRRISQLVWYCVHIIVQLNSLPGHSTECVLWSISWSKFDTVSKRQPFLIKLKIYYCRTEGSCLKILQHSWGKDSLFQIISHDWVRVPSRVIVTVGGHCFTRNPSFMNTLFIWEHPSVWFMTCEDLLLLKGGFFVVIFATNPSFG